MTKRIQVNEIVVCSIQGKPRLAKVVRVTREAVFTIVPLKGCMAVKRKASELISYQKFTDAVNLIKK